MQMADKGTKMNMGLLLKVGEGASKIPSVVRGAINFSRFVLSNEPSNETAEKTAADPKSKSVAKSVTGGPNGQLPDGEDPEDERKTNCSKSESPVWKDAHPFKGQYKRNAKGDEIYKWDYTHNEIEVFNNRGQHVGVKDPLTGLKIKNAVPGRVEIGIK